MATLLSPGVLVSEVDKSPVTVSSGDSDAVFAGNFEKGAIGAWTKISTTQELEDIFGGPNKDNYNDWYQVYNYLQYSGAIYVSRAGDLNGALTSISPVFWDSVHQLDNTRTKLDAKYVESNGASLFFEPTDKFKNGDVISISTSGSTTYDVLDVSNVMVEKSNPDYVPAIDFNVKIEGDEIENNFKVGNMLTYKISPVAPKDIKVTVSASNDSVTLYPNSKAIELIKPTDSVKLTFEASADNFRTSVFTAEFKIADIETVDLSATVENESNLQIGKTYNVAIFSSGEITVIDSTNTLGFVITSKEDGKFVKGTITPSRVGISNLLVTAKKSGYRPNTVSKDLEIHSLPAINSNIVIPSEIKVDEFKDFTLEYTPADAIAKVEVIEGSENIEVDTVNKRITGKKVGVSKIKITISKDGYSPTEVTNTIVIKEKKLEKATANIEISKVPNKATAKIDITKEVKKAGANIEISAIKKASAKVKLELFTPPASANIEISKVLNKATANVNIEKINRATAKVDLSKIPNKATAKITIKKDS